MSSSTRSNAVSESRKRKPVNGQHMVLSGYYARAKRSCTFFPYSSSESRPAAFS